MTDYKLEIEAILADYFDTAKNDKPWTPHKQMLAHKKATTQLTHLIETEKKKARQQERELLTWGKISTEVLEADDLKINFTFQSKVCDKEHFAVFANSPDTWEVAIDGHNIVSRGKPTQSEELQGEV